MPIPAPVEGLIFSILRLWKRLLLISRLSYLTLNLPALISPSLQAAGVKGRLSPVLNLTNIEGGLKLL
jgi:hypothetical protein